VIVLANLYDLNPTALAHQVADIVLKPEIERAALAKPAPEPKTAPSVQADVLASYAGLYWSDRIESSHELAVEGETLRLLTSEGPFSLAHVGAGTFQLTEAPRRFIFTFVEPEKAEGAQRLRVEVGGQKPIEYVRVDAWRPAADALSAFTGEFSSEEGLSPFQVAVDGGRLRILRRKFKPDELSPIVRDVFRTEIGRPRERGACASSERGREMPSDRVGVGNGTDSSGCQSPVRSLRQISAVVPRTRAPIEQDMPNRSHTHFIASAVSSTGSRIPK